jgi:hypothetical protein
MWSCWSTKYSLQHLFHVHFLRHLSNVTTAWDPTYWGEAFFSLCSDSRSHSLQRTTFLHSRNASCRTHRQVRRSCTIVYKLSPISVLRESNGRIENIALSKELRNLCFSPTVCMLIKRRLLKWDVHVARIGKQRSTTKLQPRNQNMVMSSVGLWPMRVCTANYRPVLSSERMLFMKKQVIVRKKKEILNLINGPKEGPDIKTNWPIDRRSQNQLTKNSSYPCGGGLEYLHRSPASRKRWQKGTQCPEI